MRLRWKRSEKPKGLARVCSGPVSSYLWDGETVYARVYCDKKTRQWYWVAGWGSVVEHRNTCDTPVDTEGEAKVQALAYVQERLAALPEGGVV